MSDILTNCGTFISTVSTNSSLLAVATLMIAACVGRLAFGTVKRFIRR